MAGVTHSVPQPHENLEFRCFSDLPSVFVPRPGRSSVDSPPLWDRLHDLQPSGRFARGVLRRNAGFGLNFVRRCSVRRFDFPVSPRGACLSGACGTERLLFCGFGPGGFRPRGLSINDWPEGVAVGKHDSRTAAGRQASRVRPVRSVVAVDAIVVGNSMRLGRWSVGERWGDRDLFQRSRRRSVYGPFEGPSPRPLDVVSDGARGNGSAPAVLPCRCVSESMRL